MTIELSVGLPPVSGTTELVQLAEQLGYARAWIFDSAPLWEDTFVHLALAAERTQRIGLSTAVLVPTQRSPMAMASAIATIARLAPGRLRVAFGTGYTARLCMGQAPMTLEAMGAYVRQVRGLLRGDIVDIDGSPAAMLHWEGLTAPRPIDVPIWLSAFGPRGRALALEVADGLIGAPMDGLDSAAMVNGTVLAAGEEFGSERSLAAVAPWRTTAWHMALCADPASLDQLPDGASWRAGIEAESAARPLHLLVHEGHVTHVPPRDQSLLAHLKSSGLDGDAAHARQVIGRFAAQGFSEVIYNPAGPDIERELRTLAAAVIDDRGAP